MVIHGSDLQGKYACFNWHIINNMAFLFRFLIVYEIFCYSEVLRLVFYSRGKRWLNLLFHKNLCLKFHEINKKTISFFQRDHKMFCYYKQNKHKLSDNMHSLMQIVISFASIILYLTMTDFSDISAFYLQKT